MIHDIIKLILCYLFPKIKHLINSRKSKIHLEIKIDSKIVNTSDIA